MRRIGLIVVAVMLCVLVVGLLERRTPPWKHLFTKDQREMKTIGIIGGVSWVSSNEYYRLLNQMAQDRLGGLHSAKILLYSIEFQDFSREERLADRGNWKPLEETMIHAAKCLERGGADCIIIASNTMNSTAELLAKHVSIPILHIADATGRAIQKQGLSKVALLGTQFTMEQPFYRERLEQRYGLTVVVPTKEERELVNTVIFDELCRGTIREESKERFQRIIERLVREEHVEGVILGCTEIPLLIQQKDVSVPVFDTMRLHTEAAYDYAVSGG